MQVQKSVVGIAIMALFAAAQVYADDKASTQDHQQHKWSADADGDGKITREEFRAAQEKRSDAMFKRMDTNGDGVIDQAERKAMSDKMRDMREHRRDMQEKTDADKPK